MDDQMKMFEEGGLYQEGGTTDPVSGNEVPTGSLQEEVRDDIDAKLSEGEFVFPADVVRYIGLENLMQLRQKAKEGLRTMEEMGQMGNSEEAVMDDDMEYNAEIDALIDEFDPDEPESMEFAVGGVVPGIPGINPPSYTPSVSRIPTYQEFMGGYSVPQYSSKQYIGPNGDIITVTFINGKAVQPIPEGYKPFTGQLIAPQVAAPQVTTEDNDGGGRDPEAEAERERAYEQYKANAATLAAYDPEFAKTWAADPANTGKFTGLADMVMKSVNTAMSMTDAVEAVAKDLGIDLEDYKNEGLARLGGKYDVEKFTKNLNDMAEDLSIGEQMREAEAEAGRKAARESFLAKEDLEEEAFRAERQAKAAREAELAREVQKEELGYDRESGSDRDEGAGTGLSDKEVEDATSDFAKGGLAAPKTSRKPRAKQTNTRGKGLARKK